MIVTCGRVRRRDSSQTDRVRVQGVSVLLLGLLFGVVWVCSAAAQYREHTSSLFGVVPVDSLGIDTTAARSPGAGEKLLWLAGASLSYALFDYAGFNLVRGNNTTTPIYRVVQALVQAGITWFLYEKLGLSTAVAFNVIWWTWGMDALFYGYTELFNVGGEWKGRGIFKSDIMENNCTWASWTPVGMARGMDNSRPIAGDALVAQFLIGAAAAITMTITF